MWRILQQPEPDDYVLARSEAHTVREFVEKAFGHTGVQIDWKGIGIDGAGIDEVSDRVLVKVDPRYFRPTEVDLVAPDH
jgi:GDPmannose 4,6-dehydratase